MVKTVNLKTISYHYEHHHEIKKQKEDELIEGHQRKNLQSRHLLAFLWSKTINFNTSVGTCWLTS